MSSSGIVVSLMVCGFRREFWKLGLTLKLRLFPSDTKMGLTKSGRKEIRYFQLIREKISPRHYFDMSEYMQIVKISKVF